MTFISNNNTHTNAFYVLYKEKRKCAGNFLFLNIYSGHALVCVKHSSFQREGQSETIVRQISLIFVSYFHRPPLRINSEYSYYLQYKLAKATISDFGGGTILINTDAILFGCIAAIQKNLFQHINWEVHANITNKKTIPTSNFWNIAMDGGQKKSKKRPNKAKERPRKVEENKVKPVRYSNCPTNICSPPLAKSSMHKTVIRIRTLRLWSTSYILPNM